MSAQEMSPRLTVGVTRIPEHDYTGPVFDNGELWDSLEEMRDCYLEEGDTIPLEVWAVVDGVRDSTRVVVLAL